jgi:peptidyl-prolyl cis-trans isomerase B (cyclophilin B)
MLVRKMVILGLFALAFVGPFFMIGTSFAGEEKMNQSENPVVVMETSEGIIKIELWPDKAPITVKNFLRYVEEGFYDGTIFHRVIDNFMIQGGGFTPDMNQKQPHEPIKNEASSDVKNDNGAIAMARTGIVDSATSQFFINVKDNDFLNHRDNTPAGFGYAVFGKVIEGMDVVDKIKKVPTTNAGPHQNVPSTPVIIKSVKVAKS